MQFDASHAKYLRPLEEEEEEGDGGADSGQEILVNILFEILRLNLETYFSSAEYWVLLDNRVLRSETLSEYTKTGQSLSKNLSFDQFSFLFQPTNI